MQELTRIKEFIRSFWAKEKEIIKPAPPSYAPQKEKVVYQYHKPQPVKISILAKEAAKNIELPNIKKIGKTSEWIAAFQWYNTYMLLPGQYKLGMSCRPCWTKVYNALKLAKDV